MASEIGSLYGSDTYRLNPNAVRFRCEAWILGKYFANKLPDFSPDITKSILKSGKPIKTTLKLSPNGLTVGDKVLDKLRANGSPYEHFEADRLIDIYQDRKYTNVVVCVLKSRLPEFNYEIYTYIVRKDNDAVAFEKLFKEIVTGEKEFTNKSMEKIYGLNTLRLSDVKPTALKPTGSINNRSTNNSKQLLPRSETPFSKSFKHQPTVVYTGKRQTQNDQINLSNKTIKKANVTEASVIKRSHCTNSSAQTPTINNYFDKTISNIGSRTIKTFLNKEGRVMADVSSYVESQTDDNEYETEAKVYIGRKNNSPYRTDQNNRIMYAERIYAASPSRLQAGTRKSQNISNNQDALYGKIKKKESQTQLLSISSSSGSSENIATRPQIVYNSQPYNNHNEYSSSNHYNYRYTNQQPTTGTFYSVVNRGPRNQKTNVFNQNEQIYYLRAPL